MPCQETTPLLSEHRALPLHAGLTPAHGSLTISRRVCRSPWPWPSQRALVIIRGAILAYFTALAPILVHNKAVESAAAGKTPWSILFDFSTLSHILQWLWYLISFLWSLVHHRHSAHENDTDDDDYDHGILNGAMVSLPSVDQMASLSDHFYFSLLYTAAHVFNFMNTLVFWAVLVPLGHVGGGLPADGNGGVFGGGGWLRPFSVVNMYGVTSLIAAGEVLFLNTIKHERVIINHVFSLMFLLAGYLGWAAVGNTMTGHYPFFWMNPKKMGGPGVVAAYASGFVGMGPAAFAVMYGLTALREKLANRGGRPEEYTRIVDSDDEHVRPDEHARTDEHVHTNGVVDSQLESRS